ncbi:TetR/AcrR family transcriptional regulator [Thalassovita mangrovi]|uniref:TetR family transcriptional regulator n=1 Tax=Thalassovita mangrovi TaxID=2692236 RepID=A0A6L8LF73_9RHOB|nr:TetR/AcrR family transcriptional regulator [Thalassovita mangrovi]MYM54383.1 TetR family transcriptional regulator [Thalassovita mangrovi]
MTQKPYHHGDLRHLLLDTAKRVVEQSGAAQLSLRSLADEAGVSTAAPYHHFKNKTALLAAVAAATMREFNAYLTSSFDAALSPQERLERLGVAYVTFARDHPELFKLIQWSDRQAETTDQELAELRKENFGILYAAVADCLPKASEETRHTACAAAWSLVHGAAVLVLDGRLGLITPMENLDATITKIVRKLDLLREIEGNIE